MVRESREVVLRVVVDHSSRHALETFAREVGSIGISFAPGTTGIFSGRPKPVPIVRLFTFFIDKSRLGRPRVQVGDGPVVEIEIPPGADVLAKPHNASATPSFIPDEQNVEVPLSLLAYARSGDKGNSSNIAIIARKPKYLPLLRREVTGEKLLAQLGKLATGPVERFEAPGLIALNFLIGNALGGGGMASRRIDPQGKAYGQMALEMRVAVPLSWQKELEQSKHQRGNLFLV